MAGDGEGSGGNAQTLAARKPRASGSGTLSFPSPPTAANAPTAISPATAHPVQYNKWPSRWTTYLSSIRLSIYPRRCCP